MIAPLIAAGLVMIGIGVAWKTFWDFYYWKYRWRAVTRPDGGYGSTIKVYVARGFGNYSSDRVEVGKLEAAQEDFYERMHELLTLAEERAKELNELPREVR